MKIKLSDLWRCEGSIDRGPYVILGVALFVLKYNLDRLITYRSLGERRCSSQSWFRKFCDARS